MIDGFEYSGNLDDLIDHFSSGDAVFVLIKRKNKRFFRRHVGRINKSVILCDKKGFFSGMNYYIYSALTSFWAFMFSSRDQGLERAFLIYSTSWPYIDSITGEDFGEDLTKVIFIGKSRA